MPDSVDLNRFVLAQAPIYDTVLSELTAGRKKTHWMWFIFPQIAGLGHSAMAQKYAIASIEEAQAYLAHPLLGSRLRECTECVNRLAGRSAHQIFGSPDDMKFHSSMTLFARASIGNSLFEEALSRFYDDIPDEQTLGRLAK